jgi:hypothetical protein
VEAGQICWDFSTVKEEEEKVNLSTLELPFLERIPLYLHPLLSLAPTRRLPSLRTSHSHHRKLMEFTLSQKIPRRLRSSALPTTLLLSPTVPSTGSTITRRIRISHAARFPQRFTLNPHSLLLSIYKASRLPIPSLQFRRSPRVDLLRPLPTFGTPREVMRNAR